MATNNFFLRFLGGIWSFIDGARRAFVNIIFLIFVLWLISVVFSTDEISIPSQAALVLLPDGNLVNQLQGDALDRATREITGDELRETLVRDLLDAMRLAKDDDRIQALVLDLDGMWGAGLSKLQDVAAGIEDFKTSGKKVIAVGDVYLQNQYFLAAHADEIYMHPLGAVFVQGYGTYKTYFRDAIDKLSIDWNIFRVGEYKSFVEPYLRNDMSPEDREATLVWLSKLWQGYQQDVSEARGYEAGKLQLYADTFVEGMRAHRGDMAQLALEEGLVDGLLTRDEMRQRLIETVGKNAKTKSFNQVSHTRFLDATRLSQIAKPSDKVGVIVASGTIVGGHQPPGTIGGESTAKLIRRAANDDSVKAVVLQVDSGGGSMFASEVILGELEQLKAHGKPLYVSMSSVAASGGYYIALAGDEIWAHSSTITGSIGVLSMFPTFNRTMDRLGVTVDGLGTTALAGAIRPDRALTEDGKAILQLGVESSYRTFVKRVAEARDLEFDAVDEVARGRVWIGEDAHRLGLVDKLGTLPELVQVAAEAAGIGDSYDVKYIKKELTLRESLLITMLSVTQSARGLVDTEKNRVSAARLWIDRFKQQIETLARFNDPRDMYLYCFCSVD